MRSLTTAQIFTQFSDPIQREALLNSWPTHRCGLCRTRAATGIWWLKFASQKPPYIRNELRALCPVCGLTECYLKWNGFMAPKLERCDLFATITCPEGDKRTAADKLIEKILTHPIGQQYIEGWRTYFRPANIHHPLAPAFKALQKVLLTLFPPDAVE